MSQETPILRREVILPDRRTLEPTIAWLATWYLIFYALFTLHAIVELTCGQPLLGP